MKSFLQTLNPNTWLTSHKRVTGIQCTDTSIRFASFNVSGKEVELYAYGEHMLSGGVIKHGKIIKPQLLITALRTLQQEYNFDDVHMVLPQEQSFIFHTTMPYPEDGKDQDIAIKDHIDTFLQLHDIPFDGSCTCEGEIININDGVYELQVTVTPDTLLASYRHVCNAVGIRVASMEVGTHMLSRACLVDAEGESCLLVDFGEEKTHISLVSEQHVMDHATHMIGSQHFIPEIQDFLNVTQADAERIHRDYGVSRKHREPALLTRLTDTLSPVRKTIDDMYVTWHTRDYKTEKQKHPITKIILTGEGAHVKGFAEHLSIASRIPVEHAHMWHATDALGYLPEIPQHESHRYAYVISAALKNMGK